jgi:hypothetical protein
MAKNLNSLKSIYGWYYAVVNLLKRDVVRADTNWPPRPDYSHLHDKPLMPPDIQNY